MTISEEKKARLGHFSDLVGPIGAFIFDHVGPIGEFIFKPCRPDLGIYFYHFQVDFATEFRIIILKLGKLY